MKQNMESPLLGANGLPNNRKWRRILCFLLAFMAVTTVGHGLVVRGNLNYWLPWGAQKYNEGVKANHEDIIESELGVIATDHGSCSEIGVSMLRLGGHAVDAAVATAICLGVSPSSSGIGGGSFMVVRSSSTSNIQAFDTRETAPLTASQNRYENKPEAKYSGAFAIGVPGELAGLHEAWLQHGRLPLRTLFKPAIKLAKDGFLVSHYLGNNIATYAKK